MLEILVNSEFVKQKKNASNKKLWNDLTLKKKKKSSKLYNVKVEVNPLSLSLSLSLSQTHTTLHYRLLVESFNPSSPPLIPNNQHLLSQLI